jgi:sugar phosphate isomerase/epimerase
MHPRISVHGLCGSTSTLQEDLEFWSAAGIDNVGIPMSKLDAAGRDTGIGDILDANLHICHVVAVQAFDLFNPAAWDRQRQALAEVVDVARALSAERLCITAGPPGPLLADEAADAFTSALRPVLNHANSHGMPIAVEHNHVVRRDLSFLNTLRDAITYARLTGVSVCAEVQNFWVEYDLERTISEGMDVIDLVQISDWVGTDPAVPPHRAALGDGDLPLERIMSWFLKAGYRGAFDIELVGPRIDQEGYQSAVTRSVHWLTDALNRLGA